MGEVDVLEEERSRTSTLSLKEKEGDIMEAKSN